MGFHRLLDSTMDPRYILRCPMLFPDSPCLHISYRPTLTSTPTKLFTSFDLDVRLPSLIARPSHFPLGSNSSKSRGLLSHSNFELKSSLRWSDVARHDYTPLRSPRRLVMEVRLVSGHVNYCSKRPMVIISRRSLQLILHVFSEHVFFFALDG